MQSVSNRKTIGMFLSALNSPYFAEIFSGADRFAREHNLNLLGFAGSPIQNDQQYYRTRSRLFALASGRKLDGLIIPSSSLFRFCSAQETDDIMELYQDIPLVTIGSSYRDRPAILNDPAGGMSSLARHLVETHGYRQFAFVRGAAGHTSSEELFSAFNQVLLEHKIQIDPRAIIQVPGLNNIRAAVQLEEFLALDLAVDCVVCTTDSMAISIMHRLLQTSREKGLAMPAVTGYNGLEEAEFTTPPLTTIDEHQETKGYEAAALLYRMMNGLEHPDQIKIPNGVILRESCGCKAASQSSGNPESMLSTKETAHFTSFLKQEKRSVSLFFFELSMLSFEKPDYHRIVQLFNRTLGTEHMHLVLFSDLQSHSLNASIQIAFRDNCFISHDDQPYFARDILPEQLLPSSRHTLIFEPLFYEDQLYGFFACSPPAELSMLESAQSMISFAIHNQHQQKRLLELKKDSAEQDKQVRDLMLQLQREQAHSTIKQLLTGIPDAAETKIDSGYGAYHAIIVQAYPWRTVSQPVQFSKHDCQILQTLEHEDLAGIVSIATPIQLDATQMVLLFSGPATSTMQKSLSAITKKLRSLPSHMAFVIAKGISVTQRDKLGESYNSAKSLLEYRMINEEIQIINADTFTVPNAGLLMPIIPPDASTRFSMALQKGDAKAAWHLLNLFIDEHAIQSAHYISMEWFYQQLCQIMNLAIGHAVSKQHGAKDLTAFLSKQKTPAMYPTLIDTLHSLVQHCAELLTSQHTPFRSNLKEQLLGFIHAQLANPNMSLDFVAEYFAINPKYLSRMFKEKTGGNFHEHVAIIRVQEAARLLDTNATMKLTELSKRTGFLRPATLTATFKKIMGLSIKDYIRSRIP